MKKPRNPFLKLPINSILNLELDWNEYFVLQLKEAGYKGTSEEEMVDQWFQDLCRNIGAEEGVDMERRGSGHVNVSNIGNGRAEIS